MRMKKIAVLCSVATLISVNAMDTAVWQGAPAALRHAAQDMQVIEAIQDLGSNLVNVTTLYTQKVAPLLTVEQKKQCAAILVHVRKMIQKSFELSQKGGNDEELQEELQEMGQELFFSYLPLLLTIQQEVTDQVAIQIEEEIREFTAKGYQILDKAADAMIKALQ